MIEDEWEAKYKRMKEIIIELNATCPYPVRDCVKCELYKSCRVINTISSVLILSNELGV